MESQSLRGLFLDNLRDIYSAEQQLTNALPKLAKAASSAKLRTAFESHLDETKEHVRRLDQIFKALDEKPTGKTCVAMQGLIKEGDEVLDKRQSWAPDLVDAGLIVAAQKVEHYEIAGYGCLRTFAEILEEGEAQSLLQETLDEEGRADKALTAIAAETNVAANEGATESQSRE